jgi:hypothetical protein
MKAMTEKSVTEAMLAARKTFMIEMRGQRYREMTPDETFLIGDFIDHAALDIVDAHADDGSDVRAA